VRRAAAKLLNSRSVTVAVLLLLLVSALTQWINFGDTRALVREVFIGRSLGQVRTRAGAPTPQEECRYVPSSQLLKQIYKAALLSGESPSPGFNTSLRGGNSTRVCATVETACHEDAMCHVNQWEATLAKPICQRERLKGCAAHQRGAGKINPEFCNHCTTARQADELKCAVTRSHCEAAMRSCFEESGNESGGYGSLRWLSFWDENAYEPSEFLGWANFGFTGNVSRICAGAAVGMQQMLKVNSYFFQRSAELVKGKRRLELQPRWRSKYLPRPFPPFTHSRICNLKPPIPPSDSKTSEPHPTLPDAPFRAAVGSLSALSWQGCYPRPPYSGFTLEMS